MKKGKSAFSSGGPPNPPGALTIIIASGANPLKQRAFLAYFVIFSKGAFDIDMSVNLRDAAVVKPIDSIDDANNIFAPINFVRPHLIF